MRVDTSQGFELCPADVCQTEAVSSACPTVADSDKFQILPAFEHPLLPAWQEFLGANDIDVAGVEFITDAAGQAITYDINTNINHNPEAETKDGRSGMRDCGVSQKSADGTISFNLATCVCGLMPG